VAAEQLVVQDGTVRAPDGRTVRYGELVSGDTLHVRAQPQSRLRDAKTRAYMGQPFRRVDIPAKVTGQVAYVHDLRLPGMVHARVVRPPSYGAQLRTFDAAAVQRLPGVVKVVRDGSYLAVIAEREHQAINAMRVLSRNAQW